MMPTSIDAFDTASPEAAAAVLDGLYGDASWIAPVVVAQRPFRTMAALEQALIGTIASAPKDEREGLIRAWKNHTPSWTTPSGLHENRESSGQTGSAYAAPARQEISALEAEYRKRFGFPFILAPQGPRGTGLSLPDIVDTLRRRLDNPPDIEACEALHNLHRRASGVLRQRLGNAPTLGNAVWDCLEELAQHSEAGYAERGQLTVTYLTPAHRTCAETLCRWMQDAGFDTVEIDAVGNVVGRYHGTSAQAPLLLTGSHYDTVRNGGKYDGRLGIAVPLVCVRELRRQSRRLPFGIELVAFAEEEGQRFPATFLGSSALTGHFDSAWLDQRDAEGVSMRTAMQQAGLDIGSIGRLKRDPARYLGFIEIHIEQGPVLYERDLPLGIVSSINGSVRYRIEMTGRASHAGTTPMNRRHDAACGMAELALYVEARAAQDGDSVGTIGELKVPDGSINVIPGRCVFTLDLRAPSDIQRDALSADVLAELQKIAERRALHWRADCLMKASAAPSSPIWQQRWEQAVRALGLPVHRMPSGAGHDAMKLHTILPQAMLFVRGQNHGISHNPLESTTSDDIQLAVDAFFHVLDQLHDELSDTSA